MVRGILFIIGLLICSQTIYGQPSNKALEDTIIESIPFELTEHNNIVIQAILNNQDSLRFMFHTATSSLTVIRDHAKSIVWDKEETVESWGGASNAKYSTNNSLSIGNFKWDSLAIWENENSGHTTDGKFGPNLFEDKIIEIDFDKSVINIHRNLPSKVRSYEKLVLNAGNGFMFIEGTSKIGTNRFTNQFLIHSGFGGTLLFDDETVKNQQLDGQLKVIREGELKDSYGNVIKTKKAVLPLFTIGDKKFRKLTVGFFEGAVGRQKMSVIGSELLKRFNIIIDAKREYIYLKANGLEKIAFNDR